MSGETIVFFFEPEAAGAAFKRFLGGSPVAGGAGRFGADFFADRLGAEAAPVGCVNVPGLKTVFEGFTGAGCVAGNSPLIGSHFILTRAQSTQAIKPPDCFKHGRPDFTHLLHG